MPKNRNSFVLAVVILVSVLVAVIAILWPRGNPNPPSSCIIAPPSDYHGDRGAAAKVGADLTAIAEQPAKFDINIDLRNQVKQAFRAIPDDEVACQMLLQTVACLSDKPNSQVAVDALLRYMREEDKCGGRQAARADLVETLKGLVHMESGQAPIHWLLEKDCANGSTRPSDSLRTIASIVLKDVDALQSQTSTQKELDFIVGEFGTYRQLVLDLGRRSEILSTITNLSSTTTNGDICAMAKEYKELHYRLAAVEENYLRHLKRQEQLQASVNNRGSAN